MALPHEAESTLGVLAAGVLLADGDGVVVYANAAAGERLQRAASDLVGGSLASLLPHDPPLASSLERDGRAEVRGVELGAGATGLVDVLLSRWGEGGVAMVVLDAGARHAAAEEIERLQGELARSEQVRTRMDAVQRELVQPTGGPTSIVGSSAPMLQMIEQVDRVAPAGATVLVHGESGSGKELVARSIHERSPRSSRAWVALNCAAMPETLLESELFGHERGAFTGADRQRMGKFELADDGTLFLDEIAELSAAAQAKLLRVLQDGTFVRVGGSETIQTDVRLIAATHRDLAEQVRRGRFREDLFYRLNVFRIDVPPLRDRREDLKELIEFFHERHARRLGKAVLPVSERSMRRLLSYRWPGNVRELENTVERATLLATGAELEIDIPDTPDLQPDRAQATQRDTASVPRDVLLDLTLDQLQRLQIMHALETRTYKVFGEEGAAKKLGIHPQTLLSRMDKLGIPRPRAMRSRLRGE